MSTADAETRHHVIISGTGRAGTSFLIHLLTELGLDTGFQPNSIELPAAERAGLEMDIRSPGASYIVKSPWLCDYIKEVVANPLIRIDHAILPVRDFAAAAASRAYVQCQISGSPDGELRVPGGLWHTDRASEQEYILRFQFTKLIEALSRCDIPITFLWYPRLARDADYLYRKVTFLLDGRDFTSFSAVFERLRRPEYVHKFTPDDN